MISKTLITLLLFIAFVANSNNSVAENYIIEKKTLSDYNNVDDENLYLPSIKKEESTNNVKMLTKTRGNILKNYEGGDESSPPQEQQDKEKIDQQSSQTPKKSLTLSQQIRKRQLEREKSFKSTDKIEIDSMASDKKDEKLDEKKSDKPQAPQESKQVEILNISNDSMDRAKKELAKRVDESKKTILTKEQINAYGMPSPSSQKFSDNNTQIRPSNISARVYNKRNNHLTEVVYEEDFISNAFKLIGSESFSRADFFAITERLNQPHILDEYGNTLLTHSIFHNKDAVAMFLIKAGIKLDTKNDFGVSPLHLAAYSGSHPTLVSIMESGGDPNIKDKYGNTPIMYAAFSGDLYAVRRIIEFKGDIDSVNNKGLDVMDFAYESQNLDLVNYLIDKGQSLIKQKDLTNLGAFDKRYFLNTKDGQKLLSEYVENMEKSRYFYYAD